MRSALKGAGIGEEYWPLQITEYCYWRNTTPREGQTKTPWELFTGEPLREPPTPRKFLLGEKVIVTLLDREKQMRHELAPRGAKATIVGFDKKAYIVEFKLKGSKKKTRTTKLEGDIKRYTILNKQAKREAPKAKKGSGRAKIDELSRSGRDDEKARSRVTRAGQPSALQKRNPRRDHARVENPPTEEGHVREDTTPEGPQRTQKEPHEVQPREERHEDFLRAIDKTVPEEPVQHYRTGSKEKCKSLSISKRVYIVGHVP